MADVISLNVNGTSYEQFKEIRVTRSLQAIVGSFEAVVANSRISTFPMKALNSATITVNGVQVIGGFINRITPSYSSPNSHTVNIQGFDKTKDVVDSTIFGNVQVNGSISLKELIQGLLITHEIEGVRVTQKADIEDFDGEEILSGETGDSLFEYIQKHAQKKKVLLGADGKGGIVIYRNQDGSSVASLINRFGENQESKIKSASSSVDFTNRFSKVIIKSQGGLGGDDISGEFDDKEVTRNKVKVIIVETVEDIKSCEDWAKWEVNKRKSDSVTYECVVQGFSSQGGIVWEPGQFVAIEDDFADMKSVMLLRDVEYSVGLQTGSTTKLTFVAKDSYKLQASDPNSKQDESGGFIM